MGSCEKTPGPLNLHQFGIKVLLVDDQPIVASAVQRMLAPEADISLHYCQDPGQALKLADELSPTVILQDLVMPDVDGLTVLRYYRAHPRLRDVPVIMLSSREEPATKAEAFASGASDYLVKLPDRIELVARIRCHSKGYISLLERNETYQALLCSQQALAAELAQASAYVVSLLPPPLTVGVPRVDWRFFPSAMLGGDSFGYHWIDRQHFAMYLLDVCGHGVGAALLSVSAINVVRSMTLPGTDFRSPAAVLTALNETFQMEQHNNLYFTMWYGVFNKETRLLRYGAAGHPAALLVAETGGVRELASNNMIIGGIPGLPYTEDSVEIVPPSRLYIYSDGVYEVTRPDGTMWTFDGFKQFLTSPEGSGEDAPDRLFRHCREMHGSDVLEDDFSMLRIRFPE